VDVRAAVVELTVRVAGGGAPTEYPATGAASGPEGLPSGAVAQARSGGAAASAGTGWAACAILTAVVRQTTPAVRPDDVLGALDVVAGLRPPAPARATRMAQGLLDDRGSLADPLGADRVTTRI
jgi:hypothetical protein